MGDFVLVRSGGLGMGNALRAGLLGASVAAITLLVSGCGGGVDHAPKGPKGGTAKPSVSVPATATDGGANAEERGALRAYEAMWKDAAAASRTADEHHPRLDDHAQGGALGLLRLTQRETRKAGKVATGGADVAPKIVDSRDKVVEINDCVDSTSWATQRKGKSSEGAEPGGHHFTEATVKLTKRGWKVSELTWRGVGTC
ncbi:hypothetical protein ACIRJS_26625 [Streptomyces sp. NPDC102340]|uniref:hypothetical protein n=1 Tax=unclassified Streptomyces TaxID=2593676 RepID=UPI0038136743